MSGQVTELSLFTGGGGGVWASRVLDAYEITPASRADMKAHARFVVSPRMLTSFNFCQVFYQVIGPVTIFVVDLKSLFYLPKVMRPHISMHKLPRSICSSPITRRFHGVFISLKNSFFKRGFFAHLKPATIESAPHRLSLPSCSVRYLRKRHSIYVHSVKLIYYLVVTFSSHENIPYIKTVFYHCTPDMGKGEKHCAGVTI